MNPNECPVAPSTLPVSASVEDRMAYLGNLQKFAICRVESIKQQMLAIQNEIQIEAPESAKAIRETVRSYELLSEVILVETRKAMRKTFQGEMP